MLVQHITFLVVKLWWQIVDSVFNAYREADSGRRDSVFKLFWEKASEALSISPIAECADGTFALPRATQMLGDLDEQEAEPVLSSLGLKVLRSELRPFAFRLPNRAGIQVIDVPHIVNALHGLGLDKRTEMSTAPTALREGTPRRELLVELERLLNRKKPLERSRAIEQLATCAVFLADDGAFWPAHSVFATDADSRKLISGICPKIRFSVGEAHEIAPTVASAVPQLSAATVIHEFEAERYSLEGAAVTQLLSWLESRKTELYSSHDLKFRMASLSIFPSAAGLKPLQDLALTGGGFEDPVGIAELLDLTALPSIRGFLAELGAKELTFDIYSSTFLPKALRTGAGVPVEKLRALIQLLAARLGEIRDNSHARSALASLELIECSDGQFRRPAEVYFVSSVVKSVLSTSVSFAKIDLKHNEAVTDLYRWLGVAQSPRLEDIVFRTIELAKSKTATAKAEIEILVKHLGERLRDAEELPHELNRLQQISWLPARWSDNRWFKPSELYLTFREYLFSTQAQFLDITQTVQRSSVQFLRLVGTRDEPTVAQVVAHLLACSGSGAAINREVYGFLNEHATDQSIDLLGGKACLMLADGKYINPRRVFWNSHPFGRFRTQLGAELFKYSDFLTRVGVRQTPTPEDAVAVLKEISSECGGKNAKLDEQCYQVVMVCWTLLTSALDSGELSHEALKSLVSEKVIPAPNGILERPSLMFFEDRAGLASKFPNLLANNVIRCPELIPATGV